MKTRDKLIVQLILHEEIDTWSYTPSLLKDRSFSRWKIVPKPNLVKPLSLLQSKSSKCFGHLAGCLCFLRQWWSFLTTASFGQTNWPILQNQLAKLNKVKRRGAWHMPPLDPSPSPSTHGSFHRFNRDTCAKNSKKNSPIRSCLRSATWYVVEENTYTREYSTEYLVWNGVLHLELTRNFPL